MLIIPYVCADFRDKSGNPIFRITADMLRTFTEIPDAVKEDMLFDMLVADGSIKTPETESQKKLLEQDPGLGMLADGKADKPAKETKSKAEAKAEAKADGKPAGTQTTETAEKK